MAKDIKIDDLPKTLASFEKCLGQIESANEIAALNWFNFQLKRRVYNRGLASGGVAIGKYVRRIGRDWGDVREAAGRQTGYVDLEFKGDQRRDIVVGRSKGRNAIGFKTDRQRLIGSGHERYRKKPIYKPDKKELRAMTAIIVRRSVKKLKDCF